MRKLPASVKSFDDNFRGRNFKIKSELMEWGI